MRISSASVFTAAITLAAISGCAVPDPDRNYTVQDNDAKVVLRSIGMPMNVDFSISSKFDACQGFERVGLVRDEGRGVLLPWVANLSSRLNRVPGELRAQVPGDSLIQVKGMGVWDAGRCGPVAASFPTQKGDTYLVEFVWTDTASCSLRVSDITVPTQPQPLAAKYRLCPRKMVGG
jgi:hypothetical protein